MPKWLLSLALDHAIVKNNYSMAVHVHLCVFWVILSCPDVVHLCIVVEVWEIPLVLGRNDKAHWALICGLIFCYLIYKSTWESKLRIHLHLWNTNESNLGRADIRTFLDGSLWRTMDHEFTSLYCPLSEAISVFIQNIFCRHTGELIFASFKCCSESFNEFWEL